MNKTNINLVIDQLQLVWRQLDGHMDGQVLEHILNTKTIIKNKFAMTFIFRKTESTMISWSKSWCKGWCVMGASISWVNARIANANIGFRYGREWGINWFRKGWHLAQITERTIGVGLLAGQCWCIIILCIDCGQSSEQNDKLNTQIWYVKSDYCYDIDWFRMFCINLSWLKSNWQATFA